MARLKREEEQQAYERMINAPLPQETFQQRFPNARYTHALGASGPSVDDDEMTYQDVDRQVALIINVLVTVIACSAGLWIVARHWATPARLALSMAGSIVVAIAEVVIYAGYIRRLKEATVEEKKKIERKQIAETWVIEPKKDAPMIKIRRHEPDPKVDDSQLKFRAAKGRRAM